MIPDPSFLEKLFGLSGRTALITGSSRGIGASIAEAYARVGAEVIIHGQSLKNIAHTQSRIQSFGGAVHTLCADLSLPDAGYALFEESEKLCGKIDILVINASAQINADLQNLTAADLEFQLNVNLRSTVQLLQKCLPKMAQRGWGRVVNLGSINQLRPKPVVTAYAATKAAQHNLIQSQARHYAQSGVLLNTLAPGLIDTDRNALYKSSNPTGWLDYVKNLNWMGRAGEATEMVGAALFLGSNACSFMTGEAIFLSGGY